MLDQKQKIIFSQNNLVNLYKYNDNLINEINYLQVTNFTKEKSNEIERDITHNKIFTEEIKTKILNVQQHLTEGELRVCKKDEERQEFTDNINDIKNEISEKNAEKEELIQNYERLKARKKELVAKLDSYKNDNVIKKQILDRRELLYNEKTGLVNDLRKLDQNFDELARYKKMSIKTLDRTTNEIFRLKEKISVYDVRIKASDEQECLKVSERTQQGQNVETLHDKFFRKQTALTILRASLSHIIVDYEAKVKIFSDEVDKLKYAKQKRSCLNPYLDSLKLLKKELQEKNLDLKGEISGRNIAHNRIINQTVINKA